MTRHSFHYELSLWKASRKYNWIAKKLYFHEIFFLVCKIEILYICHGRWLEQMISPEVLGTCNVIYKSLCGVSAMVVRHVIDPSRSTRSNSMLSVTWQSQLWHQKVKIRMCLELHVVYHFRRITCVKEITQAYFTTNKIKLKDNGIFEKITMHKLRFGHTGVNP